MEITTLALFIVPLGFISATGIHTLLVFSGVGLMVKEFSVFLSILKLLGIIYLLWLAYKSFIAKPSKIEIFPKEIPKFKMYLSALFISLTNPKALLASIMVYPLFLSSAHSYTMQSLTLSLSAMAISFIVYSSYSLAALLLKDRLGGSKLANKIVGSLYLGAACVLAQK